MSDGTHNLRMSDLVEQFADLLYRYAYRLTGNPVDAEDLTQQTFLRAQQKSHQLRDLGAAGWWLCSIMRNAYLTSRRRHSFTRSLEGLEQSLSVEEPSEESIDSDDLQRALLELPEDFRSPIILYYYEEFSYQQIAKQMRVPIGTIMSRLSRAKAFLRQRLSAVADIHHCRSRERITQ